MSELVTAHDMTKKVRTGDVLIEENVDFAGLLLSDDVQKGLTTAGFVRPSPIQLKAIPLGRCGLDLIVQAKSGTGKTCVFTVVALESLLKNHNAVQVLVLAPTREIACQVLEVVKSIGACMPHLQCHTFIGGTPLSEDRAKLGKCNVAVGTPGRIKQLIETNSLNTSNIRLFVLDEADKLVEESFQEQINWIYSTLPENKQMLALSATYPEVLAQHLTAYMRNPTFVRLNSSDPALLGIRQYYKTVPFHPVSHKLFDNKTEALVELLSSVEFHQCLVFSNYQIRAQSLSEVLNSRGWPAAFISGSQEQEHRMAAMASLKQMTCRILISTDLTSRGIDAENVNLVINLDLPPHHETYLHRIGRAGRFGSYGAALSFVSDGKETHDLKNIEEKCSTVIKELPEPVPEDLTRSSGFINLDHLVSTEVIKTRNTDNSKLSTEAEELKLGLVMPETDASTEKSPRPTTEQIEHRTNGTIGKISNGRQTNNGIVSLDCDKENSDLKEESDPSRDQAERKPKWKINNVWTTLSHDYGAECKKSEERRKMGQEDDRSNDHRRPTHTDRTSHGVQQNAELVTKENGYKKCASHKDEETTFKDKSDIVASEAEKIGAKSYSSKLPQPGYSGLRDHRGTSRTYGEICLDYESLMADESFRPMQPRKDAKGGPKVAVKAEYEKYIFGVQRLLASTCEENKLFLIGDDVKCSTTTDTSVPVDVCSKSQTRKIITSGDNPTLNTTMETCFPEQPTLPGKSVKKQEQKESTTYVNKESNESPIEQIGNGVRNESRQFFMKSASRVPNVPSRKIENVPLKSPSKEESNCELATYDAPAYPHNKWLPQVKEANDYDEEDGNGGFDEEPGNSNSCENSVSLDDDDSWTSGSDSESDDSDSDDSDSVAGGSESETDESATNDVKNNATMDGKDFYQNWYAEYQAVNYASCYQLFCMHSYYASYYEKLWKDMDLHYKSQSAGPQQKKYISQMAKWMAGKEE